MKQHEKINLEAISGIDETIVDEVTDKKITLMQQASGKPVQSVKSRKKFITIGSIAAGVVLIASVLLTLTVIIPLLGSGVPIYEGMTIRRESSISAQSDEASGQTWHQLSRPHMAYLSHTAPGGAPKDEHKKHDDLPKQDIEDMVTINVITDDEVKYYVQPGETFIIEIHIDNPRDYEIQSFTLNGQKYANYMFKDGSTMELLLLEVTAPSTPGYTEYTIDAIKYIDGTEIKDVDMTSGDKSVKAGITYPTAPSATVGGQSISTTSVDLSITVTDPDDLIGENELSVYLSDGETVLDSKPLTIGKNDIVFDNLAMNKTYAYGIVTAYDLVDGRELHEEWLLTGTFTTAGAFGISNAVSTQDAISFEVEQYGEVGEITSVSLYDAVTDVLVEMGGADTRAFTGLLSNHPYNLYVDYTYTVNGEEMTDWVAIKGITTVAKVAPTLTFDELTSDKTSVSYAIQTTDADNILHISKVELIKNGEAVKDNETALNGTFDVLLSNNAYTVKVTYTYDLNDGQGAITESITKDITTVAKVAPTLTFGEMDITDVSIKGDFHFEDVDSIGTVNSVDIYKGDTLIQNNAAKEIDFAGLEYYTEYQIRVSYSYDQNDGVGVQSETAIHLFKTFPHLSFNSCEVANTSAVNEGETIFLQVNITNPNKVVYKKVVVNGQEYDVVKNSSTETMLYCEIVNNGQFEGGETPLTVEKVIAELDGQTYTIEPKQNHISSVFINGKLEIEKINGVVYKDGQYVDTEYLFPSDTAYAYLKITFYNKTGYTIDSITINNEEYSELIRLDDEHYLIEMPHGHTNLWYEFMLSDVKYSRPDFENALTISNMNCCVLKLDSEEIQYVSTPQDLLNMDDGAKYYELTNDIDLSGIEWHGGIFNGIFNGNGYSIKNMSYVDTISTNNVNLGLFESADGIIKNLNMEGVQFIIKRELGNNGYISFGSIAARGGTQLIIDNCIVDENSFINIDGNAVGGFVGIPGYIIHVKNCTNYASIIGSDCVGGIISGWWEISQPRASIENCANYGSVTGKEVAGGIWGCVSTSVMPNVFDNCVNYGAVTSNMIAGGIIGHIYYPTTSFLFENCANYGSVTSECMETAGIVGWGDLDVNVYSPIHLENCINFGVCRGGNDLIIEFMGFDISVTITNCFSLDENVTIDQLNSKSFYTDTLGWSEEIWNFDDLDAENGKYPTLK